MPHFIPDYSAIIEEHTVSFSDGAYTTIDVFKSVVSPASAPVCLIAPALGVRGSFYKYLAYEMANNGWNVVTMDWRGNGKSSVNISRKTSFGFHEILTIDYPAIIEAIKTIFPGNPLFLLGHSLGGQLNLLYSCLSADPVNGAVLLAGGSNFYKYLSFPRKYGRKMNYFLIQMLTNLFGCFPGNRLGFAGKESKTMILDWLHESLTGKYSVRNCQYDFDRLLSELELPVLFIALYGDHFVPSSCAKFLANKLKKAKTTVTELDASNYDLNIKKFNHFNWKNSPAPIIKTINAWFDEVISSSHTDLVSNPAIIMGRSPKQDKRNGFVDYDKDKVDEYTLALLLLVSHNREEGFGARAWKGFDWDTMNRLHEKGFITNPVGKAKSVGMTEEGYKKAEELFRKFFVNK